MTKRLVIVLAVAGFLVGTTVLGQRAVPAKFESLAASTTSSLASPAMVGGLACSCSCGINCDGTCTYSVGSCIYVWDAITCVGNCCAAAPRPGVGECDSLLD